MVQVYTPERVLGLLGDLQREVHLLLLFLKSVEAVEVLQWREGSREVRCRVVVEGEGGRGRRNTPALRALSGQARLPLMQQPACHA